MVRLAITDFSSQEESEHFYLDNDLENSKRLFTYNSFKKNEVYVSKNSVYDFYSLNLLSKEYLDGNEFLIYIADEEFVLLFNHKTIYSVKLNLNFITDDIIKSILMTNHITMLSSGGKINKINYIIDSKFRAAIEVLLQENIKNDIKEIICFKLGDSKDLVENLNELDTTNSFYSKISILFILAFAIFYGMFFGLNDLKEDYLTHPSLDPIKQELEFENRFISRQDKTLINVQKEYDDLISCISNKEDIK
ncbi:hypothetical protein AAX26_01891 [Aliarcobacter thereius]|uniref:hypothetical protein n=1 Tax=Aliarcobacter thereius TaxID=544718 RepID=UPI0008285434|nr:hypothetical protein [Aliarcobacter thereius]OCL85465.1 hypothetical protein AAX26_01891 [Aliarcobacter thereius]TLT06460.1 hypothetical protein FE243_07675 [Aliarcobacter thereius]